MAFLEFTSGSVEIPCSLDPDANDEASEEVGERRRAFNGDLHSTIRRRPRVWKFKTRWLPVAAAVTLRTSLEATAPIQFNGEAMDGTGTDINCHVEITREGRRRFAAATPDAGQHRTIEFTLHEQ